MGRFLPSGQLGQTFLTHAALAFGGWFGAVKLRGWQDLSNIGGQEVRPVNISINHRMQLSEGCGDSTAAACQGSNLFCPDWQLC